MTLRKICAICAEGMVFMGIIEFRFRDSGEIWEVDLDNFHRRAGFYIRSARHHLRWFHKYFPELCRRSSLSCELHLNGYYTGSIEIYVNPEWRATVYHWWWPIDPDPDNDSLNAYRSSLHSCYNRKEDKVNG